MNTKVTKGRRHKGKRKSFAADYADYADYKKILAAKDADLRIRAM